MGMIDDMSKGPWRFHDVEGFTVVGPDGRAIALCEGVSNREEENYANTALVRAAPDLLELLFQYRDDLKHPPNGESVGRRLDRVEHLIALLDEK